MPLETRYVFSVDKSQLDTALGQMKGDLAGVDAANQKVGASTNTLNGFLKDARAGHRQYAFAAREGSMALGELSTVMVGPNGLTQALLSLIHI